MRVFSTRFFVVPIVVLEIGGFLGFVVTYPFISFLPPAPIGPLSFALLSLHLSYYVFDLQNPHTLYVIGIIMIIILKFFIYRSLRGTKIVKFSSSRILIMAMLATYLIEILRTCSLVTIIFYSLKVCYYAIASSLIATLSIDLTTFSYIKYRDSIKNQAYRKWIPILASLWSLIIWLPVTLTPEEWLHWIEILFYPTPITTIMCIWTTITILQTTIATIYYILLHETETNYNETSCNYYLIHYSWSSNFGFDW